MQIKNFSDSKLLAAIKTVRQREKGEMLDVLAHLQEVYDRRLYADLKYQSLRSYCIGELDYSGDEAQLRVDAIKVIKDVPEVANEIKEGSLSLTSVCGAKRFFRREKVKTTKEKRKIINRIKNQSAQKANQTLFALSKDKPKPKEKVSQVSATHSQLSVTVDHETIDLLEKIRGGLAHKMGSLSLGEVIKILCDDADKKVNPRKIKNKNKKNVSARTASAALTRQIKSHGKCENCASTFALEVDHIKAYAKGGLSNEKNLRLLCRSCNQRSAIREFGQSSIGRFLN